MRKDDHFPVVGFVWPAFLFSVRFLLTHPVCVAAGEWGICNIRQEAGLKFQKVEQDALKELRKFSLGPDQATASNPIPDVRGLLPKLKNDNIDDHFWEIGKRQSQPYKGRRLAMYGQSQWQSSARIGVLAKIPSYILLWFLDCLCPEQIGNIAYFILS